MAFSDFIANPSDQGLETYNHLFPSTQIGNGAGLDPMMPPLGGKYARGSSHSAGQKPNVDYHNYMASNALGSTMSDNNIAQQFAAIYDSPSRPSAYGEPEEPTQASSHGGHGHDEDKLRKRILELEDNKRQALLMVEKMDSELTTLRKANEIMRSYTGY
ncbi:hypothetical protein MMC34_002214 [Xylographa carneopallida]|nr:hypothetical protein [Xylographa carneopallida]